MSRAWKSFWYHFLLITPWNFPGSKAQEEAIYFTVLELLKVYCHIHLPPEPSQEGIDHWRHDNLDWDASSPNSPEWTLDDKTAHCEHLSFLSHWPNVSVWDKDITFLGCLVLYGWQSSCLLLSWSRACYGMLHGIWCPQGAFQGQIIVPLSQIIN